MNDNEAIGDHGDLFVTRECDYCDGLVIEYYLTCDPGVRSGNEDPEPNRIIDIPPALAEWFRARVNEWADSIKEAAKESP